MRLWYLTYDGYELAAFEIVFCGTWVHPGLRERVIHIVEIGDIIYTYLSFWQR